LQVVFLEQNPLVVIKLNEEKKMLLDKLEVLDGKHIILASSSPRRQQILRDNMGLKNFTIVVSDFDEQSLDKKSFDHPYDYVLKNAECKAMSVYASLHAKKEPMDLIIGADTIVSLGEHILEKPKDIQDAHRILRQLSGKTHMVYTGVALIHNAFGGPHTTTFYDATEVTFSELSDQFIDRYIHTGEPMDKAGAYGIQAIGGSMVERIKGCYFNVMGMPLNRLCRELSHHPILQ
jgi:septum formation protein